MYRIIISPEWYPNKENVLSAIFTKKHVEIIARKHKVVVAFAMVSKFEKKRYNLVIEDGNYTTVICYFRASKFPFLNKYVDYLNYFIAHHKAIKKAYSILVKVDFFHIHVLPKAAIIPFLYYLIKNVPYFISEHSTIYIRQTSGFLESRIKRLLAKYSKGMSAVSNSLKLAMIDNSLTHANFKIIPNVVDEDVFKVKPVSVNKTINFLHVSRLEEKAKNTIGILNAFDLLFKKYQNIELHIVGGLNHTISDAELYSNHLISKKNIFFHGIKLGKEIVPFYHQANYFVMFSNYETQAVVILEALSCGLPIIATKLPALDEYLHAGNSLQVNVKDETELFNKMEACITNSHSFWKSENISEEIKAKFNVNNIDRDFNDLYHKGLKF